MKIELRKFGSVLTSRPDGREAFAAVRSTLDLTAPKVEIDFNGVLSLSPSWADEFFSALEQIYGGRLVYLPSQNPSVIATLKILREQNQ
jgi:hypothetical protein